MSGVAIVYNQSLKAPGGGAELSLLDREVAARVRAFHRTIPGYQPTPCLSLNRLADYLGLGAILVKDESYRFGLNAFKVLGGSYAVATVLAERLGMEVDDTSYAYLRSSEVRQKLGTLTFCTTTDGNHGRGVAWAAEQFGHRAVVFMPAGSERVRRDAIRAHGAACTITDLNYDDCVRLARDQARQHGWVTVQDTAWEGYRHVPVAVMQGYLTLALEILEQLEAAGDEPPTHVVLQAGVGSFAAAVLGFFMSTLDTEIPVFLIVEPEAADCFYVSARENDGKPHVVGGSHPTLMAGLACGEPNPIIWEILRDYPTAYVSCSDHIATLGMRLLGNPLQGDRPIVSGESGAVTSGFLHWVMRTEAGREARQRLGLDDSARVLCISTEGDTSPQIYREVVWFGRDRL